MSARGALAGERPTWKRLLEILLFLSALLAGLGGLISGDRAVDARPVERTAVAASAAAELGALAADVAIQVAGSSPSPRASAAGTLPVLFAVVSAAAQSAPVDERRLE